MKPKWKREAQKTRRRERLGRLRDVFADGVRTIARAHARADRMLADNPLPFTTKEASEGLEDVGRIEAWSKFHLGGMGVKVASDSSRSVSQSDERRPDGTVGKPTGRGSL